MIEKWRNGFEVVYGQRRHRKGESWFKRTTAKVFYRSLRRLAQVNIPVDTGDFRLMGPKAVQAFRALPEHNRFNRGLVAWLGFSQAAVPFCRQRRLKGKTKYHLRAMVKLALSGITSFSYLPLRCATWLGLAASGFAVVYLALRTILSAVGVAAFGSTGMVSSIYFLAGVQLVAIGTVGEYLGRVFEEVVGRPIYLVKESTDGSFGVLPPDRRRVR
jgi:dolichol-phosphate mannosyltransferase